MTPIWWSDLTECITLARWLVEEGYIDQRDQLDVIEEPWKYNAEHADFLLARDAERAQMELMVGHRVPGTGRTV
jgi:hypothetical protein